MISVITLDFGNTLVPVSAAGLRGVVAHTATAIGAGLGPFDVDEVLRAWGEERERQFREEVPQFREVDLAVRVVRILARLRGMAPPPADHHWDDAAAARLSRPDEVSWAVEVYSRGFVASLPPAPAAGALLERLAGSYRLGILSNWPLAATIDRYVEAAGWTPYLAAVVVSQRVGTIKPHPAIFAAARTALGDPEPTAILHVGDDWAADIVGAKRAGWRAAWLTSRPADSPLPGPSGTSRPRWIWSSPRSTTWRLGWRACADRAGTGIGRLGVMEARDRIANLGLLAAAGVLWVIVALLVTTRDPYQDAMAGYLGALLIGLAVGLTAVPLAWLVVFARHRRIAYKGDWMRAARRGAWIGLFVTVLVILRLVDAFQLPIVLFLAAIFVVAEITLSAER